MPVLVAGCYAYTPLGMVVPNSETEVSLALTDQGRAAAGMTLGSGLDRVEGKVVLATDSTYVLRVLRLRDIRGVETKWSGETVTINRAWVGNAYVRHFSRSRTWVAAGAFTGAVAALIATRTFGIGGPTLQNPGGGGGGRTQ